jgi:hypothetical protein
MFFRGRQIPYNLEKTTIMALLTGKSAGKSGKSAIGGEGIGNQGPGIGKGQRSWRQAWNQLFIAGY